MAGTVGAVANCGLEPGGCRVQFFIDARAAVYGIPGGNCDAGRTSVRAQRGVVASRAGWNRWGIGVLDEVLRRSASDHRSLVLRSAKTVHQGGAVHRCDVACDGRLAMVGLRARFAILGS